MSFAMFFVAEYINMITVLAVATKLFFFFQAEDGIRDLTVTGVQTCALPICTARDRRPRHLDEDGTGTHLPPRSGRTGPGGRMAGRATTDLGAATRPAGRVRPRAQGEIGRASCRERG